MDKNEYMVRLYKAYGELNNKGVKRIVWNLINKGLWESQGSVIDQQHKLGSRKSEGFLVAVEKLNNIMSDERE